MNAMSNDRSFANFLVLRDEQPFLIVNATLANVQRLVARFASDASHRFSFRPCA